MGKRNQETIHSRRREIQPRGKLAEYFRASGTSRNGKQTVFVSDFNNNSDVGSGRLNFRFNPRNTNEVEPDNRGPMNSFASRTFILPVTIASRVGTSYYCSNITTAISDLKGVQLSTSHYCMLEGTPFYAFIIAVKELDSTILSRMLKKSNEATRCVMSRYDKPSGSFVLGELELKPTKHDVALPSA